MQTETPASIAGLILEQIADAVIYADVSGTVGLWNAAATALFGYSAAQAVGQSLDLIIPEHLRRAHWSAYEAAMKTGELKLSGKPTLTRATHQSGRKLYVELTFALVKDAAGVPCGAAAVARDVTERVEQQRRARQENSSGQ